MTRKFLKSLKLLLEIALLSGMAAVPAILVRMGARMTLTALVLIWLILGLPLAILLVADIRAMYREEAEKEAEEYREYMEWAKTHGEEGEK